MHTKQLQTSTQLFFPLTTPLSSSCLQPLASLPSLRGLGFVDPTLPTDALPQHDMKGALVASQI
jgi:hypothetical protein